MSPFDRPIIAVHDDANRYVPASIETRAGSFVNGNKCDTRPMVSVELLAAHVFELALHLALGVAFNDGLALIADVFAARNADQQLGASVQKVQ